MACLTLWARTAGTGPLRLLQNLEVIMKASAVAGDSRDGHDLALTSRRRRWTENRHHGCCGRGVSRKRVEVVVIQKNRLQQKKVHSRNRCTWRIIPTISPAACKTVSKSIVEWEARTMA